MWRASVLAIGAALGVGMLLHGASSFAQPRARAAKHAEPSASRSAHEIVLLHPPRALSQALHTALSPWGVRLRSADRERPGATLPGTARQASDLARELGTDTLVWISSNEDGAALWMYEAKAETIRARPFPDKPLDETLAAALALSVKTWLLSAEPEREPEPAPAPAPEGTPPAPPALPISAVADSGVSAAPEPVALSVLFHAGARRGAVASMATEARYGAELRLSPWRAANGAEQLWVGARLDMGGTSEVERPTVRGEYSDTSGGVSVGLSHRFASIVSAGLHLGGALHRSALASAFQPDGTPARPETSWFPSVQARPELDLALGPVGVVLQGTVGAPLRKQDYNVNKVTRIETGTVWWMLGGALRLNVL